MKEILEHADKRGVTNGLEIKKYTLTALYKFLEENYNKLDYNDMVQIIGTAAEKLSDERGSKDNPGGKKSFRVLSKHAGKSLINDFYNGR